VLLRGGFRVELICSGTSCWNMQNQSAVDLVTRDLLMALATPSRYSLAIMYPSEGFVAGLMDGCARRSRWRQLSHGV